MEYPGKVASFELSLRLPKKKKVTALVVAKGVIGREIVLTSQRAIKRRALIAAKLAIWLENAKIQEEEGREIERVVVVDLLLEMIIEVITTGVGEAMMTIEVVALVLIVTIIVVMSTSRYLLQLTAMVIGMEIVGTVVLAADIVLVLVLLLLLTAFDPFLLVVDHFLLVLSIGEAAVL